MLDFSIKSNKTCTKRIPCSSSTTPCERFRMKDSTSTSATTWRGQLRDATLNQRLGSFPAKSRAEILPRCRRDYPLPPPINRGSVDDLREEKIGSKNQKKLASLPRFCSIFLYLSLPAVPATNQSHHKLLHHQLHHRKPTQPPSSHRDSLSLLLPAFLSPLQTSSSCTVATPETKISINAATSLLSATQTSSASHLCQVVSPYFCPVPAHVSSACNGRIINLEYGSDLIWPSPNLWAGFGPPPNLLGWDRPTLL